MSPFFWLRAYDNFCVPTTLKPSNIPNAGFGRFSLKTIEKDTLVNSSQIISLDEYLSLSRAKGGASQNYLIMMNGLEDLDTLFQYFKSFDVLSDSEIRCKMSYYLFSVLDKLSIQANSNYLNHSKNSNLFYKVEKGIYSLYTSREIHPYEELLMDYEEYSDLPQYCLDWYKKHNLSAFLTT